MKRLAFLLLVLMAVPALAEPDDDDTSQTKPKKKKKKKGKKDKKKKKEKEPEPTIEIEDDPTTKPPPGPSTSTTDTPPEATLTAPITATAPAPLAGATPIELAKRPIVLQQGRFDVGVYVAAPRGPDLTATTSPSPFGKWIGFELRAEYGVIDKLSAGIAIDLAPVTSDSASTDNAPSKIGGFGADAHYAILDGIAANEAEPLQLALHGSLGMRKYDAARGPFTVPYYGFGLGPAIGLGVTVKKTFMAQKLALVTDPRLVIQSGGSTTIDTTTMMTTTELLIAFDLPLWLMYQVAPEISVGGRTGIYTGQKLSFSPKDHLDIPFVAEAVYTAMKNQLDVGVDLGLGNLTPPGTTGPLETFILGVFVTWRNK